MKIILTVALGIAIGSSASAQATTRIDASTAGRFAALALACVQKEYPNKIAHVLNSADDVKAPHELTPTFYGCYDWHSSVHGHWLLARLIREFPNAPFSRDAIAALKANITPAHVAGEVAYLNGIGRESFERPYGLAWLLQLGAELRETQTPDASQLSSTLKPLEAAVVARLKEWLPKLAYPIREGEHAQTAFAFGVILDYARKNDPALATMVVSKVREFHLMDRDCPINYEPSGQDFLSPCIAEADAMRRVLPPREFATWLTRFLPRIPTGNSGAWLPIGIVTDKTDGKLAHLDGLNLSRAWMLEGIASSLPSGDLRIRALMAAARIHAKSGLAAVTGEHYAGGHWLGSFATYLTTRRGVSTNEPAPFGARSTGGACVPETDPWMKYLRSRYDRTAHGKLVTNAAICRKASVALGQRDRLGRYYDVLVLPLANGEYAVIAPALGTSSAGEFDCVVHLDRQLRYKAHMCG